MPRLHFLDLPPEILVQTLGSLDLYDLISCKRTHSSLNVCIRDHQILQYHIAKQVAGVEDNPHHHAGASDRLALLKSRETGWERLRIDFQQTVQVEHQASGIYDLSGGVYLLGSQNKSEVHYCVLPKKKTHQARWEVIDVHRRLIDIGLSIYEHDLIAVVTTTPSETNTGRFHIEIQLLQFSTGKPHPLAKVPTLHVSETKWGFPALAIEIVGDNLALILTHAPNPLHHPEDGLYIFQWKTGSRKMAVTVPHRTYAGIVFLSPDLLLLPNMHCETLDLWHIPSAPGDPAPLRPIRSLALPELTQTHYISSFSCRCEPNPATTEGPPHSDDPFHPRWQDAVAIFNVRIQSVDNPMSATFSLFAHRSALLALCPSSPDPPPPAGRRRAPVSAQVALREVGPEPEVQPAGGSTPRTSSAREDTRFPAAIPWSAWGPPISRWFDTEDMPTRWITTSCGQRCVIYTQSPVPLLEGEEEPSPMITVLDFNPINVRRLGAAEKASRRREGARVKEQGWNESDANRHMEVVDFATALVCDMFETPIRSALPYASVTMTTRGYPTYEGLLMDEERLLGLRSNNEETISAVDVMHLG